MKKLITKLMLIAMPFLVINNQALALTSDAGTASASMDSICDGGQTTLILTGYTGDIQWQSFDGSIWIDETGIGATTDMYTVTLSVTTDFRAVVTDPGFPSDTSNVITITVGVTAPTTTGATRCGYGPVTLTASGGGATFKWYDVPTGGIPLYTGSSFTTNVASTTTFYASSATNGGGSATTPMPPQQTTYSPQSRGYWFTAPSDFTITGLYVPEPANGATQNIAVLLFTGGVPPPAFPTLSNAFTVLYLTQNNPATGVIPVTIPVFSGDVIGVIATRGTGDINSYAPSPYTTTIDGQSVVLTRMGMQYGLSVQTPIDVWQEAGGSISRLELTYEVGCESSRTPAVATVNPSDSISISANPPALCQGQSSTITVSSSNSGYTYTWSPATGLSGTTGTTVTANPVTPITYTVVADDGTCGAIDSVFMSVGPASVAGTAAISSDTICAGTSAFLTLTGYTGNIQWQHFDGTNWVNETGPGSTTDNYEVSPLASTIFQAVVTSGGCDPDTTIQLSLDVLNIVDPVTINDTICDGGVVNLIATGVGVLNWYTSTSGGPIIYTGSTYSPNITSTTTYYVQASAGGRFNVGPANLGIGSQLPLAGNDYGLQFDVIQQCTLEKVYVSPGISSGNITINLRQTAGGPIINTATIPVTSFSGLVPVNLGFTLNPGSYRLELATGSVQLYYNSTGAVYPYTVVGAPVTITGYFNPNPGTGQYYYFFYNWEVNVGCSSGFVPVTGVVNTSPAVPTISQNGTVLTSSAPAGNQWNLNGSPISGATGTTYDMSLTGPGTYTVTVTIDGCSSVSTPVIYTGLEDILEQAGISVYPNPVSDVLTISFANRPKEDASVTIFDNIGKKMYSDVIIENRKEIPWSFPAGSYSVEIKTGDQVYKTRVVKM